MNWSGEKNTHREREREREKNINSINLFPIWMWISGFMSLTQRIHITKSIHLTVDPYESFGCSIFFVSFKFNRLSQYYLNLEPSEEQRLWKKNKHKEQEQERPMNTRLTNIAWKIVLNVITHSWTHWVKYYYLFGTLQIDRDVVVVIVESETEYYYM